MAANRLPASWINALDPAAGARPSRWTAARAGAPRCPEISRRSRPASEPTVTVPSSFGRGELRRCLRAPFARNVIPGADAADRARGRSCSRPHACAARRCGRPVRRRAAQGKVIGSQRAKTRHSADTDPNHMFKINNLWLLKFPTMRLASFNMENIFERPHKFARCIMVSAVALLVASAAGFACLTWPSFAATGEERDDVVIFLPGPLPGNVMIADQIRAVLSAVP